MPMIKVQQAFDRADISELPWDDAPEDGRPAYFLTSPLRARMRVRVPAQAASATCAM